MSNITFVASDALEQDTTLVAARLIHRAMFYASMSERESDPSERATLERKSLALLRQACRIEKGVA